MTERSLKPENTLIGTLQDACEFTTSQQTENENRIGRDLDAQDEIAVDVTSTEAVDYKDDTEVSGYAHQSAELVRKVGAAANARLIRGSENQTSLEMSISEVAELISRELPSMASDNVPVESKGHIADRGSDLYTARAEFLRDKPDDYTQHAPKWHQHGIITHSREFARSITDLIPLYLEQWGLSEKADIILSQQIDGLEKKDLLTIAGLLHDIGKFSSRTEIIEDGTVRSYSFTGHEEHSGVIIRDDKVRQTLEDLGLGAAQIEYIAKCAELHFELGKVRTAFYRHEGYNMAVIDSDSFTEGIVETIERHPDYALEIGLLYLADSLSKTEVKATGQSDDEIEAETETLTKELASKNLDLRLIAQAKQMPVNIKLVRKYLNTWASLC